ncbi:MAG: ECF-type sigma factor [Acidobacteriota bacterium]
MERATPEPEKKRMEDSRSEATLALEELVAGREEATERLLPLVYDQLRQLAAGYLRRERADHTLQPTALVHEAFLQLIGQRREGWEGRSHFLAVAAIVMRRLLTEHARRRGAAKRGADWQRITFPAELGEESPLDVGELLDLDRALTELAELDERQAKIVELRYYGGMSTPEIATALGIGTSTVERDWVTARAWLHRRIATGT